MSRSNIVCVFSIGDSDVYRATRKYSNIMKNKLFTKPSKGKCYFDLIYFFPSIRNGSKRNHPYFPVLYVFPVRLTEGLSTASLIFHLMMETLAVQLCPS